MAQTTPPTITPAPAAPQRGNKATFSGLVDAFLTWLITAVTQFSAVATNVYNNAVDAFNSAAAAANSAAAAAAQATAATSGVNAIAWVPGTYALWEVRFSPIDGRTYRRKVAGSSATDPSADPTNWLLISDRGLTPYLHVRNQQPSGTSGATSAVGNNVVVLNTTVANSITGASMSGNAVTLPAGTYDFYASVPAGGGKCRLTLYSQTDSADILTSSGAVAGVGAAGATPGQYNLVCTGRFALAAAKTVLLHAYTEQVGALGTAISSGQAEVFGSLQIWKAA